MVTDGGLSVAAISSALNFGYRSVQTGYELQAVPEQTQKLLATIETCKRDIQYAQSLRRKKSSVLNGQEKAHIDRKIEDTEAALDGLEMLVEATRVDMMTKFGGVSAWNRALWVVRDGPQVGTSLARLNAASIALNGLVSIMSLRDGNRGIDEEHFAHHKNHHGGTGFPPPPDDGSEYMQLRQKRQRRPSQHGTTTAPTSETWGSDESTELNSEISAPPRNFANPFSNVYELEGSHTQFPAPPSQATSHLIPLSLRPGPTSLQLFGPVEDTQRLGSSQAQRLGSRAAWLCSQVEGSGADHEDTGAAVLVEPTGDDRASIRSSWAAWSFAHTEESGADYDDQRSSTFDEPRENAPGNWNQHGRMRGEENPGRLNGNLGGGKHSWLAYRASLQE